MWLIKPENYIETKNMVIKFGGSAQGLSWISLFEQVHLYAPSNELNWNSEATFFRAKPILVAKKTEIVTGKATLLWKQLNYCQI